MFGRKKETSKKILEYLSKQKWPVTTGDVAKAAGVSWQTAQINLLKLLSNKDVKYKKIGRQNHWSIIKKKRLFFRKEEK
jgi:Mn-dependent DtxR family transcriptional regulator